MNHLALRELLSTLQSPYVESFHEEKERHFNFVLVGKNRKWEVCLYFPERFPYCLPKSLLLNQELIGTLPHVNQLGTICIEESDTLFTDYTRPMEVVCQYLEDVVKFLNRISLGIYQDELLDELEGYYSPNKSVNSFYQASNKTETVYLRVIEPESKKGPKNSIPVVISGRDQPLPNEFSNVKHLGKYRIIKILHLPLEIAALPPKGGESFSSQYFSTLFSCMNEQSKQRAIKLSKKCRPFNTFYIFLTMPRTSGERTQFLLRFTANKHLPHPLLEHTDDWEVELFAVSRNSKEYLIERGGGDILISNKKVAVVGCGSVGSQVTNMLAKAGVGELVLIDPDLLSSDNIYRHHLGGRELNFEPNKKTGSVGSLHKVNALSYQIKRDLPYIKVNAKPVELAEVIDCKSLIDCDVIVVAVGAPSVNLQINKLLKDNNFSHVVFCWNEAAGIGGHSIALDLRQSCYQCLYTQGKQLGAESELSLVSVGQPISKNLTGCAGVFTPFSFIDSNRTAELAASHVVNMLRNNSTGLADSWRGDNLANLKTTERYSTIPLKERVNIKRNTECKVCNV